jgi:hypothetical protein
MTITFFYDTTSSNEIGIYQHFEETCCLHLQGGRVTTEVADSYENLDIYLATICHIPVY